MLEVGSFFSPIFAPYLRRLWDRDRVSKGGRGITVEYNMGMKKLMARCSKIAPVKLPLYAEQVKNTRKPCPT